MSRSTGAARSGSRRSAGPGFSTKAPEGAGPWPRRCSPSHALPTMTCMMSQPAHAIWTVGHSNHQFDRFARLLMDERIEYLIDVRSYPYSRYAPQYGREDLQASIPRLGIDY